MHKCWCSTVAADSTNLHVLTILCWVLQLMRHLCSRMYIAALFINLHMESTAQVMQHDQP